MESSLYRPLTGRCRGNSDDLEWSSKSFTWTFYLGSEDLCLLRWQNLKTCRTWCFENDIPKGTTRFSVFAKEFAVIVPNPIFHYGRPSRFAPICFNARRLDDSASLLVPHNLESWISHPKESELNLTASLFRYPNKKTFIRWVRIFRRFAHRVNERDAEVGLSW